MFCHNAEYFMNSSKIFFSRTNNVDLRFFLKPAPLPPGSEGKEMIRLVATLNNLDNLDLGDQSHAVIQADAGHPCLLAWSCQLQRTSPMHSAFHCHCSRPGGHDAHDVGGGDYDAGGAMMTVRLAILTIHAIIPSTWPMPRRR